MATHFADDPYNDRRATWNDTSEWPVRARCHFCGKPIDGTDARDFTRADQPHHPGCEVEPHDAQAPIDDAAPVACDATHGGVCDSPPCYHDAVPERCSRCQIAAPAGPPGTLCWSCLGNCNSCGGIGGGHRFGCPRPRPVASDRTPTVEVPVTPMRDLVYGTKETRQAFTAAAGETSPSTHPWPGDES